VFPEYGTRSIYLDWVKVLAAVFHWDPSVTNRQIPSTLHAVDVYSETADNMEEQLEPLITVMYGTCYLELEWGYIYEAIHKFPFRSLRC